MNFLKLTWYFKTLIIIGIILLVLILTIMISRGLMNYRSNRNIDTLYESIESNQTEVIKDDDINQLPEPVYQWLLNSGVVGRERIKKVSLKQTGQMRLNPDDEWLTPKANQEINVTDPGFVWTVNLPMAFTKGRDFFYQGNGEMLIKIAGLIPIVNVKDNEKINESALHRFLMEICWYPTAAIEDYIHWEGISDNQARAYMIYQGMEIYADFYFENNDIVRVETIRYTGADESSTRELCIADLIEHQTFDGYRVPSKINITWVEDQVEFTWYKLEITEMNMN